MYKRQTLLMGLSRKGFLGAITGETVAANRVYGSAGGALWLSLIHISEPTRPY